MLRIKTLLIKSRLHCNNIIAKITLEKMMVYDKHYASCVLKSLDTKPECLVGEGVSPPLTPPT